MSSLENQLYVDFKKSMEVYNLFKNFYVKKQISNFCNFNKSLTIEENLNNLSFHLLNVKATACASYAYKPILIELVARLINNPNIERKYIEVNNIDICIEGTYVLSSLSLIITYTQEISVLTEHFLTQKDFFYCLKNCSNSISQNELQMLLLSFYRLILTDKARFNRFVDPQLLYTLLSQESTTDVNKYISILILSMYVSMAEEARIQMIEVHTDQTKLLGELDGDKNIDFKYLSLLEAQRLSNMSKLDPLEDTFVPSATTVAFAESNLSPGVSIISGILVPNIISLSSPEKKFENSKSNFVQITKSLEAIRSFAMYTKKSEPVLLVGTAGSGKTFLVDEMARRLHIEDTNNLVKIHLNQQTDSKSLLGTYTSGTKPGTFEWKNGVLTTAVKEGKWVLIEDIDKAPNEVLSILVGLLEHRQITLPSRGEVLKAGNGFQLISTIRSVPRGDETLHLPEIIGLRLWNVLQLPDLDENDLKTILNQKFLLLSRYTDLFIKCYFTVKSICDSRRFVSMNKGAQPRQISIRDLMKFCRRSEQIFKHHDIKSADDLIHDDVFDLIFQEAIDCFTSAIFEREPIELLTRQIGAQLEIPTSRIELQLSKNVPVTEIFEDGLRAGRSYNKKQTIIGLHKYQNKVAVGNTTSFATTNHAARLMEKIGVGISMCEPLLLVGETGTGKTTVVQQMAKILNKKLTVINLSQQTEVGDLLGGFKPINAKTIALPLQEDFEQLFERSFSTVKNAQFLKLLSKCFNKAQWKNTCRLWKEAFKMALNTFTKDDSDEETSTNDDSSKKKKRRLNSYEKSELLKEWNEIKIRVANFEKQVIDMNHSFIFKFVEGSLVNAVKKGDWVLLDEMNLASPETLDSISDLLAEYSEQRSVLLSEKGDVESIKAHPDFRIFGCMNPATDVGKKDLPQSIRSRFTEIYVASPDQDIEDLLMIIDKYIGKYSLSDEWIGNDVAELYLAAKKLSDNNQIVDGANQKPHFSIRTLTRTLLYAREIASIYGLRRSLYEGFCMSLLTLLDSKSEALLLPLIEKYTIGRLKNPKSVMSQIPSNPSTQDTQYIQFKHYWMQRGSEEPQPQAHYIITPFVEKNMMNLVRATSGGRFPVLIQGPTSAGKTSMIHYLAKITGHKFVRINNHEHTDLQEYLGTYVSDDSGKLIFKEGILVEALREGHWIVLDELNLAPTDVLEALNRLLDDNRELFIPETQEVVRPHPDFMLFATQNPPGLYGGRKVLSKAFRNRFLELHFDDIPQDELEIILRERCQIAPSYAKKIVEVYKELSLTRQTGRLFEQKNSFATLRDLFRWAQREAVGYEQLAANGYMLLAERVRRSEEKLVVKQALEKVMRVKLDMDSYYRSLEMKELLDLDGPVIWTKAMRRLAVLVMTSMQNNEPLLLVGETGCGKTTVCQMIAKFFKKELIIVNAHQNTETGDLLGAQRPIRNRSELQKKFIDTLRQVFQTRNCTISDDMSYKDAIEFWNKYKTENDVSEDDYTLLEKQKNDCDALFEWNDGPLVNAMKSGSYFLLDEISLADDSVLERLNSVLEPERTLFLAEKGSDDAFIIAHDGFQFLATMNPGGDYGKKELSPALRNRFTEIWVPSMEDFDDVRQIVKAKLSTGLKHLSDAIVNFSRWYGKQMGGGDATSGVISLRDILAWINFINTAHSNQVEDMAALLHGACMVFIDSLGTHNTAYLAEDEKKLNSVKLEYVRKLSEFTKHDLIPIYSTKPTVEVCGPKLVCGSFVLDRKLDAPDVTSFNLKAPTTASNAMRVIRALQVSKPILLEGSPGVGKTSLITALAQATGNELTRINLSEQTDLIDLFGSDSPIEGGKAGEFVWRNAPFLRAMQRGEWVLLDEMNLASQSVLEGLNACLDHRGEVYIPELDKSFTSHPNFKVFAAQNPQMQGGGRKGLPKSFINRFSVVYIDMLDETDLRLIAHHLYPEIDHSLCDKLILFMSKLEEQVVRKKQWGSAGSPWEFNLRDTLRWLSLIKSPHISNLMFPSEFFDLIVRHRFRSDSDRLKATELFESILGPIEKKDPYYALQVNSVQAQSSLLKRNELIQFQTDAKICNLQCNVNILETVLCCIKQAYPLILVGPSGSGKSNLIKLAANVIGAKCYEFSMNSDIDSMDLLGGYEQADYVRTFSKHSQNINEFLLKLIAVNAQLSSKESVVICQIACKLIKSFNEAPLSSLNVTEVLSELNILNQTINNIELEKLIKSLSLVKNSIDTGSVNVNFEWFDGLLIEAVEKGYWLVLDNANLCSPSVLDRLNSLLETDGSLIINECTNDDGSPRVIQTHPDFRLFMTSDPKYGELSRAMRNRSVEVFVDTLNDRATKFDRHLLELPTQSFSNDNNSIDLNEMKISMVGKPLAFFSNVNDSNLTNLTLFLDYYNLALKSDNRFSASIILQFIPMKLIENMSELLKLSSNSSEFMHSLFFARIQKQIDTLNDFHFIDTIQDIYSLVFELSPLVSNTKLIVPSNQSLSLLNNYSLIPLIKEVKTYAVSNETSYCFATFFMISNAIDFLKDLETKAKTINASILNPLEQLAAVSFGREIKRVPKLDVYKWVIEIFTFIKNQCSIIVRSSIFSSDNIFEALFNLLVLWSNYVTAASKMNTTAVRVYHDHLIKWIERYGKTLDPSLYNNLKSFIECFSNELKLERGSSMTILWNACRDIYPQTDVAWNNYELLMKLSIKFDEVVFGQFPESIDDVNVLRKLFVDLFIACLEKTQNPEFEQLLQMIESKIEELSSISNEFLIKRAHPFTEQFRSLLGFIESKSTYEKQALNLDSETLTLCLLADKSTSDITCFQKTELFKPYPKVFGSLWQKSGSLQLPLFDDSFFKSIMEMNLKVGKTEGGTIDQTLFDLKFFISQLVKKSPDILCDHLSYFSSILSEWIVYIHLIHVDLLEDCSKADILSLFDKATIDSLLEYCRIFSSNGYSAYAEIFNTYFTPSVLSMKKGLTMESLGECYILISCGFILLYMPDSAYDPAAVDHILYHDFIKLQNVVSDMRSAFVKARTIRFGDQSIYSETQLPTVPLDSINETPRVYRDSEPAERLFEEWHLFFSSYLDRKHIEFLLSTATELSEKANSQIENFTKNASHFVLRLKENYSRFSDLNDILIGFVHSLKLGIYFLHTAHQNASIENPSPLWTANAALIFSPSQIDALFSQVHALCKKISVNDYNAETVYIYLLILSKVYPNSKNSIQNDSYNKILMTLYYRWSLRTLKTQEQESTESGVYKFSDPTMDAEADFKKLFPDSDDVIDLNAADAANSGSDLDEINYQIARAYVTKFCPEEYSNLNEISVASMRSYAALEKITDVSSSEQKNASALTFLLSLLKDSYNKFTVSKTHKDIDFYNGYDFAQTRAAGKVVKNLQIAVAELLKKWPEHATLSELFRICAEFLSYAASTPIYRLLAKVEQIFTFIAEWEKYAHSGVSLASHYKSVSSLIVSWRQLELASWKQVFANEEHQIEKRIGKWWFHLFESIIVPTLNGEIFDEETEVKVLAAINIFISQATYGEFEYRLNLLSAFALHVYQIEPTSTLNDSLQNVVRYYKQFTPQISETILSVKKELEKKANEIILLASWKDVNIEALKQSSRRSHHNLYKVIRKYRDCLVRPTKPLIEAGLPLSVKTHTEKPVLHKRKIQLSGDLKQIEKLCSEVSGWENRASRLKNIIQVEKNLDVYITDIEKVKLRSLHSFAKSVFEDSEILRKETPSVYTKENKKIISSLKTEKYKLMSNTIKDLKNMGLKLHMTIDIQKALPSSTAILAISKSFIDTEFEGCDAYFFRMIDLLPRLRAAVSEVHTDIPPADANKCLAASEHLLYRLLKERNIIIKFDAFNSSLKSILSNLEKFTTTSSNHLISSSTVYSLGATRNEILNFVSQLPLVIDYTIQALNSASQFSQKTYDYGLLNNAISLLNKISISNESLIGSFEMSQFGLLKSFYDDFISSLNAWKLQNTEVSFIIDFLLEWIQIQDINFALVCEIKSEKVNLNDLEHSFREILNAVLVSVQRIHKFNFDETKTEVLDDDDDMNWLVRDQKKLNKMVDLLYPATIIRKLNHTLLLLQNAEFDDKSSLVAAALIEHSLPILQHYFNMVQIVQHKLQEMYIDVSHGCFELSNLLHTICSKGFCQPEPPNEEKQDNNLKDGTGLGDGEGAENNSNDVEDDEDLSEQAQQPNDDKQDDQDDENDDAVDIKGDMAGDLENVSDQDKDEDEEGENEEEEEELDEEIDDLDDMDPNAVDDKMWDEEASSNSKEKEAEDMPDNSQTNDDMQAMEDDKNEENKEKENGNDDQKMEDTLNQEDNQEEKENDDNAEEEEDVGEQEDEVKNEENEQFDQNAAEADALELPDDMNLDSEGEDDSDENEGPDEKFEDNLDNADEAEEKDDEDENVDADADVEMDKDEPEGDEQNEEVEGSPASESDAENNDEQDEDETENKDAMDVDTEINEEPGVDSDEELKDGAEEDENLNENKTEDDQTKQEELEGIEGAESGANDIDDESAVKQQSGTKADGADADADQENDDVGASNGGAEFQNEDDTQNDKEEETLDPKEASRDKAAESMKQLGDSMKEFHRRRQEIKESTDDDLVDQKSGERPDEFQHLEGDNAENETQALGSANKEEAQALNDDMAIDDDENEEKIQNDVEEKEQEPTVENSKEDDIEMNGDEVNEDDFAGEKRSGFMMERNKEVDEFSANLNMDIDEESDEDYIHEEYDTENHVSHIEGETRPYEEAEALWKKADESTRDLTSSLCEQLRLILDPTLSTKLKGDYKTGKRLNMKRIIPYIASQFRKDKIWMRRTKPSKRQYQIMISLDDSKSMAESHAVDIAFESVALVSKALSQLESGQISIMKFGTDSTVVHPFEKQFGSNSGVNVFREFKFDDTRTDIRKLVSKSLKVFNDARGYGDADLWQLEIIISDGVCEDHETIQRLVRKAREQKVMIVFVIIDGLNSNESIMDMSQANYTTDTNGKMQLQVTKYLDTFPFEFYVVVHHINELPEMLSLILRQYFTELVSS